MYDVIVLGTGPGGYYFTELAGKHKLKVAVIEKRYFGGVCLNVGCIPSKSLLNSAKVYNYAKHASNYGVNVENASFDHVAAVARKDKKVKQIVGGVKGLLKHAKADIFEGEGKFHSKENGIYKIEINGEILEAKHVIVATCSRAIIPPIPGMREEYNDGKGDVIKNVQVLSLPEQPENMVVIGGGVIGLEMAAYYSTIGTKVTVIEMADKIAGPTDGEISTKLQDYLTTQNEIEFKLGCKVTKLEDKKVFFEDKEGNENSVEYDKVLVSVGRAPNVSGIQAENVGLYVERGAIVVDEQMQTNLPGVYAIGDVKGHTMLAHAAYREAEVALDAILGKNTIVEYDSMPSVIYTNPEVSAVGLSEEQCKEKGLNYEVKKTSLMVSGRYLAENDDFDGLLKIILEKDTGIILGIHIIGAYASEIIHAGSLMINRHMNSDMINKLILPHPTVGELLKNVLMTK